MSNIYCISGFGADERVFSKLNFSGNNISFIQWETPLKKESIEEYAKRITGKISAENPVLIGLSFGGIMAIEISKIIKTNKVILISSVKTFHEMPVWMRISGKFNLDKIFPLKSFSLIEPVENYNLGLETEEEYQLVKEYRRNIRQQYVNWAVHQIINWKNEFIPENIFHIHGGKDHIFPIKNIKANYVITDGGHFMIMNRTAKLNSILSKCLKK
jgi:hypothetical protein